MHVHSDVGIPRNTQKFHPEIPPVSAVEILVETKEINSTYFCLLWGFTYPYPLSETINTTLSEWEGGDNQDGKFKKHYFSPES